MSFPGRGEARGGRGGLRGNLKIHALLYLQDLVIDFLLCYKIY